MKKKRTRWIVAVAVAACVALAVGMVAVWPHLKPDGEKPPVSAKTEHTSVSTMESGGGDTTATKTEKPIESDKTTTTTVVKPTIPQAPLVKPLALASPAYPKMAARPADGYGDGYDEWKADVRAQRAQAEGHTDGMTAYYARTMAQFLAGEAGENRVYSPLNVYMALAMLAETAEGNSRKQILDLLGVSDLTTLREKCSGLWNGVYLNDGAVTSVLANSLWLSDNDYWQYDMDTVNALAQHYYASTFEGVMGSEEYNKALQDWINEQTDNLLKEQASGLKFDPTTVLALASTICFKAKWEGGFYSENNQQGIFHTSLGKDVSCVYMSDWNMTTAYFGDNFTAVSLGLDDGAYEMIFFLPDKGVTVDSLITDRQVLNLMQGKTGSVDSKYLKVNMSIPKFDMVSDQDLIGGLKQLGVTDVFDAEKSDFGAILTQQTEPVWINKVQHAARVAIDEEGVTAAAYTVMIAPGSAMPKDEMDFVLDRPFMFAITGPGDTILFTGVVENP
ncbi:MAG: serpin family protein [Clostridia bacterium]|nr:serpin family protein [Clostridia bacterium]